MNVIEFPNGNSMDEAAETIQKFESDLLDGKIVGFFIVGIGADDSTYAYVGKTQRMSRLRMGGALQNALHIFNHGEEV